MTTRTGKRRPSRRMRQAEPPLPARDEALHLKIDGLGLQASLGIYPHERRQRQAIVVDIRWSMARGDLLAGDEIGNTVDYDTIVQAIESVVADRHFNLLETLVLSIEERLLAAFPIRNLHLSVCKPAAIPAARGVSVSSHGAWFHQAIFSDQP